MRSARILVVDDEPGMLRAVERVLSGTHHVIGTRSSRDALSLAAEFNPDLAIVDIRMPDLDGFELMARLKARFPDLDVILMTGSVDDLDEKLVRAIRSPAFYFIQKPFDREVLKTLVERCVELRWRREEQPPPSQAARDRDGRGARVPAGPVARPRGGREPAGDLLPVHALFGPRRRPLRLCRGSLRTDRAAHRRRLRPRCVGGDADRHRQERVPRLARRRVRAACRGAAGLDRPGGVQPGTIRHAGRRADRPGSAPAALCECGPSADRRCGAARGSPSGWRAPARSSHRCCPDRRGTSGGADWSRAISFCCIRTASRKSSPTTMAAQKRDSTTIIERASAGGAPLLDAILAEVQHELAGRPQPDDLTLLTARVLASRSPTRQA